MSVIPETNPELLSESENRETDRYNIKDQQVIIAFTDSDIPYNQKPYGLKNSNYPHQENPVSKISLSRLDSLTKFYENSMKTDRNDRNNFIKKVYFLVATQLSITISFVGIILGFQVIKENIRQTSYIALGTFISAFIISLITICCIKPARKYPWNYVLLFSFTILITYTIGYISAYFDSIAVLSASFTTLGIVFSLAIYVHFSKKDFRVCTGITISIITGMIFFGLSMTFAYVSVVSSVIGFAVVIIFSVFIVYDIQLICGGRYDALNYDDYVIGAIVLYIDIIALFLYMLRLLMGKQ
ncbi:hypothetical protein SteCoe_24057 [Stentor coeruleus]|uniref:Uncharacterized protein n=1 Tax=Stentor coeruleus TaxID=5963 RepID=A0A1R2BIX6_9CILI|nr:hypothetical protein SteCoe_24057 [Stentor coeruleus]